VESQPLSVPSGPTGLLLVDPSQDELDRLLGDLSNSGHQVWTACSGRDALPIILREGPQIVIAAFESEEVSGVDLCRVIRAHEGIGFTYVVLADTFHEESRLVEAFDAGADDYIVKPLGGKEIRARLLAARRMIAMQAAINEQNISMHRLNAQLAVANQRLLNLSTIDELTGLYNRREAMNRLQESWAAAGRQGRPLACLVVDVDQFRRFSEEHGRSVGDLVLKETARLLRNHARREDAVFRIGEEEFLVLCFDSTLQNALGAGERLRGIVEAHALQLGGESVKVTASIGVAARTATHVRPLDMVAEADRAMHQAKLAGRNCVRVCEGTPLDAASDPSPGKQSESPRCHQMESPEDASYSVFLVQSHAAQRRLLRELLEDRGYRVAEATGGLDAFPKLDRFEPDVVVVDVDMPVLDGFACTQRLKSQTRTQDIPVILVGSKYDAAALQAASDAGADDLLPAPIVPEEFLLRVRSMCRLHRQAKELSETRTQTSQQAWALAELLDFSTTVAVASGVESILDSTMEVTASLSGASCVALLLPDASGAFLEVRRRTSLGAEWSQVAPVPIAGNGLIAEAYRTCRSFLLGSDDDLERVGNTPLELPVRPPGAVVPLNASDQAVGILVLSERWSEEGLSPAELGYLEMICNTAGAALAEATLAAGQQEAHNTIVLGLAKLAEQRDNDTGRHVERVSRFATLLAEQLREQGDFVDEIDDGFIEDMSRAIVLHDIGKVAIPDHILLKPGRLTDDEMQIMRTHAVVGAETLESVIARVPGVTFLEMARDIAIAHHEWYNGNGYPYGTSGDEIPVSARIAAVADVYDALTSARPYKEPMTHEKAAGILKEMSGAQFDPLVLKAFECRTEEIDRLHVELSDVLPEPEPELAATT
jgi:diguanylate cyclase (GGDEF)-like protein